MCFLSGLKPELVDKRPLKVCLLLFRYVICYINTYGELTYPVVLLVGLLEILAGRSSTTTTCRVHVSGPVAYG